MVAFFANIGEEEEEEEKRKWQGNRSKQESLGKGKQLYYVFIVIPNTDTLKSMDREALVPERAASVLRMLTRTRLVPANGMFSFLSRELFTPSFSERLYYNPYSFG